MFIDLYTETIYKTFEADKNEGKRLTWYFGLRQNDVTVLFNESLQNHLFSQSVESTKGSTQTHTQSALGKDFNTLY